jgi:glycine C-acetyltransferase
MIFSSGYNTNVGLMIGLCPDNNDVLLYDEYSHASLHDGMKASRIKALQFRHNDMVHLEELLKKQERSRSIFICVEGIYSMDGDMTPLPKVVALAKKYNAIVLLDDAHASLVIGENGAGTSSVFDLEKDIDIIMGTFSKAFAVTGGFLAASEEIIEHMRFFSRSYMFSASLPIPVVASVLAALDINEEHPELRKQLFNNIEYAKSKLQQFDMVCEPEGAIIALRVPTTINIRKAARMFHDRGVFINSIEYPAVPRSEQRFRISLMATHKKEQIDKLAEVVEEVWSKTVEIA